MITEKIKLSDLLHAEYRNYDTQGAAYVFEDGSLVMIQYHDNLLTTRDLNIRLYEDRYFDFIFETMRDYQQGFFAVSFASRIEGVAQLLYIKRKE